MSGVQKPMQHPAADFVRSPKRRGGKACCSANTKKL